ncbi:MAG: hypothetical protein KDI60_21620 [Xanthomonadales bacterium]|nr:hypothetical protein [Xanthomonadales bacterium]MCB1614337.1 hypothetical protein [Xanthomonadales bacterium]
MRSSIQVLTVFLGLYGAHAVAQSADGAGIRPADGYGLQLQSTVGLGPNCAETANLTLPPGAQEVTVCLQALNATDNTLYLHEIVSERLGTVVANVFYTLPGNESVFYTYSVPLDLSAALVSRWLASNERGPVACAVAWSLVLIESHSRRADIPFDTTLVCPRQSSD